MKNILLLNCTKNGKPSKGDAPFPILIKNEIKRLVDDYIEEPLRNIIDEILTSN